MRLQKYLAAAGVASRRKSEEYIIAGKVKVNGVVVTELGTQVKDTDIIKFNNKVVSIVTTKIYYMLNKPRGYITTAKDENGRKTVIDLIPNKNERVYPVGRLDYNTSGLLLLTNDGNFAYQLTHPKHTITKTYIVVVDGTVSNSQLQTLRTGVTIDDYTTKPSTAERIAITNNTTTLQIIISEGKNRQVRKMCAAIGHNVISLKRIAIGNVELNDLKTGKIRKLTKDEVAHFSKYHTK
ncbi:pseudouridine synthase [Candidatus Epulonipiscium viviparus]|uniref:pseudouridine synthase n=1 Tax=Candidatus Epulonipiscium viviparus TaxID=420336 RepID=UPI0027381476|nr:pseudouridine synthase [Candidatus Epulopiscium viviparus]